MLGSTIAIKIRMSLNYNLLVFYITRILDIDYLLRLWIKVHSTYKLKNAQLTFKNDNFLWRQRWLFAVLSCSQFILTEWSINSTSAYIYLSGCWIPNVSKLTPFSLILQNVQTSFAHLVRNMLTYCNKHWIIDIFSIHYLWLMRF